MFIEDCHGLTLGDDVSINRGCNLSCGGGLEIGDYVAIGHGVSIADGTVVAAGAVVTRSVEEPDTIVGGIPARRLKNRLSGV